MYEQFRNYALDNFNSTIFDVEIQRMMSKRGAYLISMLQEEDITLVVMGYKDIKIMNNAE